MLLRSSVRRRGIPRGSAWHPRTPLASAHVPAQGHRLPRCVPVVVEGFIGEQALRGGSRLVDYEPVVEQVECLRGDRRDVPPPDDRGGFGKVEYVEKLRNKVADDRQIDTSMGKSSTFGALLFRPISPFFALWTSDPDAGSNSSVPATCIIASRSASASRRRALASPEKGVAGVDGVVGLVVIARESIGAAENNRADQVLDRPVHLVTAKRDAR